MVGEGEIDRLELLVAGISEVTNPQPARQLSAPETDDELRRRARDALHGVVRGTVDALRFGLLSVPGVQDVAIIEAPNGVAGEIRIEVAYGDERQEVRDQVIARIDELRPAGIRVISSEAARKRLNVRVELTLAGAGLPDPEVASLTGDAEDRLAEYLTNISPGGKVRQAKLLALALEDDRIVDATVVLLPEGEAETDELTLDSGEILEVVRPFSFPSPAYEEQPGAMPATSATVSAILPIHLVAGVTLADATDAINLALDSHLSSRGPDASLTVDGLAAAIRDDTRFALVRSDVVVTIETSDGRFQQLTDGAGEYTPAEKETLQKGMVDVEAREGGV